MLVYISLLLLAVPAFGRHDEFKLLEGHKVRDDFSSPLPYTYINDEDLPDNFNWGNINGHSYLTHSLNQHIPQYCEFLDWETLFCIFCVIVMGLTLKDTFSL